MPRYWILQPALHRPRTVSLEQMSALLQALGQAHEHAVAERLLARLRGRHPQRTPRDTDVLRCLLDGMSAAAMAQGLGLTLASARSHPKRLY